MKKNGGNPESTEENGSRYCGDSRVTPSCHFLATQDDAEDDCSFALCHLGIETPGFVFSTASPLEPHITRTYSLKTPVGSSAQHRTDPHAAGNQVAALSQRRSEQANASGGAAPTPKARALSPGSMMSSSVHSQRSSGVVFADGGPGLELTDAFEELQAFFQGGTLADGPTPTSSTKVGGVLAVLRDGVVVHPPPQKSGLGTASYRKGACVCR